jgi:hypothetical protein
VLQTLQVQYNTPDGQIAYSTSPLAPTATSCSQATVNVIPPLTASALWLPNDSQTHYARFQLQDPGDVVSVDVYATADGLPTVGLSVVLCSACDGNLATNCNGCPPGTTDCIVKFENDTPLPTWLRVVNQGTSTDAGYPPPEPLPWTS